MKEIDKFITTITNLEPIEFIGLARVLKVKLFTEGDELKPRDFSDVFSDVLEAFSKCGRTRRREILKLTKDATKTLKRN